MVITICSAFVAELIMGSDLRIVQADRVDKIIQDLRATGFDVDVRERTVAPTRVHCREFGIPVPREPIAIRRIECRRGGCSIVLTVARDGEESGETRIYIPNLGSWRPCRHRELLALQTDVTAMLEANGAYWPYG